MFKEFADVLQKVYLKIVDEKDRKNIERLTYFLRFKRKAKKRP